MLLKLTSINSYFFRVDFKDSKEIIEFEKTNEKLNKTNKHLQENNRERERERKELVKISVTFLLVLMTELFFSTNQLHVLNV